MDKNRVLEALRTLQAELSDAEQLDDQSRAALQQVAGEIQAQLGLARPLTSDESETLAQRLHDAVLEFETEHPQLTSTVNQVAAALANLGI
jgi:hypothetical protein